MMRANVEAMKQVVGEQTVPTIYFMDFVRTKPAMLIEPMPPAPFDDFVFVYMTSNGPLGTITNIVRVKDRKAVTTLSFNGYTAQTWTVGVDLDRPDQSMHNPTVSMPLAIRETLPEILHCLRAMTPIDRDARSRLSHSVRRRLDVEDCKRAKFVTIQPSIVITPRSEPVGTHASPIGHDRRGHWRTYKRTGKRVWVNAMAINGGGDGRREYRV